MDVHHACAVPMGNTLARSSKTKSGTKKVTFPLSRYFRVHLVAAQRILFLSRRTLYPGKMRSTTFQRWIECRDAFMFDEVTKVCTLVYALRYIEHLFCFAIYRTFFLLVYSYVVDQCSSTAGKTAPRQDLTRYLSYLNHGLRPTHCVNWELVARHKGYMDAANGVVFGTCASGCETYPLSPTVRRCICP